MQIDQILVSASPGDAQYSAARELRTLLARIGDSRMFARHVHADLADDVIRLEHYDRHRDGEGVLVYHASIGDPVVTSFLLQRRERLVLVYHNVTPGHFFDEVDPRFAALLRQGRASVRVLRDRTGLALAVSPYNARDLRAMGFQNVKVSPLIIDIDRLRAVEPHEPTLNHLRNGVPGPVLLYVGQLLPHKRPDFLLQALHVLTTHHRADVTLALVGAGRIEPYRRRLEEFTRSLALGRAWFPGPVDDRELAAFFRGATMFVTASEHEGFCVPLVEAMALDVPVVARRFAAVPETMGEAGLAVAPEAGPTELAHAIDGLLDRPAARDLLVERGRTRLKEFEPNHARAVFAEHLRSFL